MVERVLREKISFRRLCRDSDRATYADNEYRRQLNRTMIKVSIDESAYEAEHIRGQCTRVDGVHH